MPPEWEQTSNARLRRIFGWWPWKELQKLIESFDASVLLNEGLDAVFLEGGLKAWSDSSRTLEDIASDGTDGSAQP